MNLILSIIVSTIAVFVSAYILPGVKIEGWTTALVVAIVLGVINTILRPILLVLTLPINILTLGLFTFVIMGLCVWLASALVPGFEVANFWWAMGFALVLALVNSFLSAVAPIN